MVGVVYDTSKCCITGGARSVVWSSAKVLRVYFLLTRKDRVWTLFLSAYIPPFFVCARACLALALSGIDVEIKRSYTCR